MQIRLIAGQIQRQLATQLAFTDPPLQPLNSPAALLDLHMHQPLKSDTFTLYMPFATYIGAQLLEALARRVKSDVEFDLLGGIAVDQLTGINIERLGPERLLTFLGGLSLNQVIDIDRKSTRLNSSHVRISYAVFCL